MYLLPPPETQESLETVADLFNYYTDPNPLTYATDELKKKTLLQNRYISRPPDLDPDYLVRYWEDGMRTRITPDQYDELIQDLELPLIYPFPIVTPGDCSNSYVDDGQRPIFYFEDRRKYCFAAREQALLLSSGFNPYTGRKLSTEFLTRLRENLEYGNFEQCIADGAGGTHYSFLSEETQTWLDKWSRGDWVYSDRRQVIRIPPVVRKELLPYKPCDPVRLYRGVYLATGEVGRVVNLDYLNPSSWTVELRLARAFADGGPSANARGGPGIVVEILAQPKDILCDFLKLDYRTNEPEVILLPGYYQVTVVEVI
jgi:hypothetical protein